MKILEALAISVMEPKVAVKIFSALAHDTRLAVFRLLVEAGATGVTPSDLGEKLQIPATTLSFHLSQLSVAGLVETRRVGRATFYVANFEAIQSLTAFLFENCCKSEDGGWVIGPLPTIAALAAKTKPRGGSRSSAQARRRA